MQLPVPRLRVRSMLLVVAALGLLAAWPGRWIYDRVLRQMDTAAIVGQGGKIIYGERGYAVELGKADPRHLRSLNEAVAVDLSGTGAIDLDLEPLRGFASLRMLNLSGCPITDKGLANLSGLKQLEY
ncbi:MAG TPA: hypothetical protein VGZ22_12235, partial [Isosphaeraceae bacterium]|nr:hypothetical protein [Isosphaeraceae bacterium]